jgi:hypothetical protein
MMSGLSPEARALLDAARDGMSPDAAAIRRIRGKIDGAVGAGAGASAIAVKLGIVGIVVALAVGAGLYGRPRSADAPRLDMPTAQLEVAATIVRPMVAVEPEIEMAPISMKRTRAVHKAAEPVIEAPRAVAAVADARADLAREVELIDLAMTALRSGDSAGALAALHTHAVETAGAGQLAEDAAAIEVEALCRIHDATVAAKLDAFDARYPRSAQRSRLTTACR